MDPAKRLKLMALDRLRKLETNPRPAVVTVPDDEQEEELPRKKQLPPPPKKPSPVKEEKKKAFEDLQAAINDDRIVPAPGPPSKLTTPKPPTPPRPLPAPAPAPAPPQIKPQQRLINIMFQRHVDSWKSKELRNRVNMVVMKPDVDSEEIFAYLTKQLPGPKRRHKVLQASDYTTTELWNKIDGVCHSLNMDDVVPCYQACIVVDAFDEQFDVICRELQNYATDIQKLQKDQSKAKKFRDSLPAIFIIINSNSVYDDMRLGRLRRLITGNELQGKLITLQANVSDLVKPIVDSVAPDGMTEQQIVEFMMQREDWLREQLAISRTATFAQLQVSLELRCWLSFPNTKASDAKSHRADTFGSQIQTLTRIYDVFKPRTITLFKAAPPSVAAVRGEIIGSVGGFPLRQFQKLQQTEVLDFHAPVPTGPEITHHMWGSLEELESCVLHLFNTSLDLCVLKPPRDIHPGPVLRMPHPSNPSTTIEIRPSRGLYPALDACLYFDKVDSVAIQRRGSGDTYILLHESSYVVGRCITAANTRDAVSHHREHQLVSTAFYESLKRPKPSSYSYKRPPISDHPKLVDVVVKEEGKEIDKEDIGLVYRVFPVSYFDRFVPKNATHPLKHLSAL